MQVVAVATASIYHQLRPEVVPSPRESGITTDRPEAQGAIKLLELEGMGWVPEAVSRVESREVIGRQVIATAMTLIFR